jgi:MarR family transcriptional regulator, organic hydroperoxide resistance regulator
MMLKSIMAISFEYSFHDYYSHGNYIRWSGPCLEHDEVMNAESQANAGYLVWRLSNKWRAAMDRTLAPHGLTHAQYSVLASLFGMSRDGHRPSQRELADHTGLEPVFISKLVRALEQAGFIHRATHPDDPRAVELTLTPHGETVVQGAIPAVRGLQDELTRELGGRDGAETKLLTQMLRRLIG